MKILKNKYFFKTIYIHNLIEERREKTLRFK
jgi:hypothetical protein